MLGKGRGARAQRQGSAMVGQKRGRHGGASSTPACSSGWRWPLVGPATRGGGVGSEASPNRGKWVRMVALTEESVDGGCSCVIPMRRRASDGRLWTRAGEGVEECHTQPSRGKSGAVKEKGEKGVARWQPTRFIGCVTARREKGERGVGVSWPGATTRWKRTWEMSFRQVCLCYSMGWRAQTGLIHIRISNGFNLFQNLSNFE
jgi:hypothetical protein